MTPGKDSDEDSDLLTQIKDKKKELDDLIKKLKDSKSQKTVVDLTTCSTEGPNTEEIKEKELLQRSPESVDVVKISERQQECSVIEETESTPSTLIIDDKTKEQERIVDTLYVSDSESETSSVEEITVTMKPKGGFLEDLKTLVSPDTLQQVQTTDTIVNVVQDKKSSVSSDSLQEVQTTLPKDTTTETVQEDIYSSEMHKDAELDSQDNTQVQVVEKQDALEESRVEMDVGEPVAGPSGLPVEWQGASVVREHT